MGLRHGLTPLPPEPTSLSGSHPALSTAPLPAHLAPRSRCTARCSLPGGMPTQHMECQLSSQLGTRGIPSPSLHTPIPTLPLTPGVLFPGTHRRSHSPMQRPESPWIQSQINPKPSRRHQSRVVITRGQPRDKPWENPKKDVSPEFSSSSKKTLKPGTSIRRRWQHRIRSPKP